MDPFWFMFGAVALTGGLGVIFLFFYFRGRAQAALRRAWPTTIGTIRHCKLIHRSSSSLNTGAANQAKYQIDLRYAYQVDGQRLYGDCISSAMQGRVLGTFAAMEVVERFETGKRVTVHYDPRNPTQCCLEPGMGNGIRLLGGVIFLLIAGGLGWLFFVGFDTESDIVRVGHTDQRQGQVEASQLEAELRSKKRQTRAMEAQLKAERDQAAALAASENAKKLLSAKALAALHVKKGNEQLGKRRYRRAVVSFRKAIEQDQDFAKAYRGLGMAYAKQRKKRESCLAYKEYLGLLPADSKERPVLKQMVKAGGCW